MVMNDLSDKMTIANSKDMLEKAGLYTFGRENPATGVHYFFDAKTKEYISKVSLSKSNGEIQNLYMEALSKG